MPPVLPENSLCLIFLTFFRRVARSFGAPDLDGESVYEKLNEIEFERPRHCE